MPGQSLCIQQLHKNYGNAHILKGIDIDTLPGEFLVLVGPSGCGKSTLLNCIAGLEEVSQGDISIGDRLVTNEAPKNRDIAMVFQSYALYPTMSVYDNMAFGMKVRGESAGQAEKCVQEAAELLQIEDLLDRKPSQLSGGQRQRVAMGRALVRDPALFLFDEPLSNLDAKLRLEMRAEILRLHQSTQASIVYVTHDQVEAMTLASKIVVMDGGVIQQTGTPHEIYTQPANAFVAKFMGSPPMNLCKAQVVGNELVINDTTRIVWQDDPGSLKGRQEVLVGMRPEHFKLFSEADSAVNCIEVQADLIEHTGADQFVLFKLNDSNFTARLPAEAVLDENSIQLTIPQAKLHLFDAQSGVALLRIS